MNLRIRRLGLALAVLYLILFVQLNRVQFFGSERLEENVHNTRGLVREFGQARGPIITADGVLVARSIKHDGSVDFRREYPEGELYAHIVGYQSLNVAASGIERIYNEELAGLPVDQQFRSVADLFRDRDTAATVRLTINHDVQSAARHALGDQRGSVVVLDPGRGEIIAMWTWPSFDPNLLATPDGETANSAYNELLNDPANPLLAKAYREVFFPGSTFKLVTATAGLETGAITATAPVIPDTDRYDPLPSGAPIGNFGGSICGGDLFEILRVSCNTAFAEIGAEWVGPNAMIAAAEGFGFNARPPFDLPSPATSRFPADYGAYLADVAFYRGGLEAELVRPNGSVPVHENSARLAQTAIGQNDVAATPLQIAMIAAAIANEGVVMTPHVVSELRAADGSVYDTVDPETWRIAMRSTTANVLEEAMRNVVENGTARNMAIEGLVVGGKTGTAQLGTNPPKSHAWVVGFAGLPDEPASLAIAVIVEAQEGASGQTGGRVAVPIAKAVIEKFFAR